ncbi:related to TRM12 tRNA methyltransferase, required for the formation of the hypermodified nucleoside wybutosine in the phenylalanine-accepting tRNA [Ramularia collo-cygni]|uniref:tRNA wybutosine-synthesizing protein 2 n=1 Tax=Ramularia collo-cygni TaxID=112498 RepID=A0A2D3V659_9PEZI|nr:related to TRM12 tRNA methyltransferase, required for the formation of the hypermodified nucleoside wybutosine in the phenylalanine-accepting tRNA [Ramularia collo-cygni]CZT20197.1 related to TRM12 tRNA methyltransferase, required for the formation of the hypermodified nucleoside wybutosine in the phenylalanine-accepting tRNA [Ramularia collo-cygni]
MEKATKPWLVRHDIPPSKWTAFARKLSKYTIYGCMLLLPANTFEGPEWESIQPYLRDDSLEELYTLIAKYLKTTVIAINKPIPPHQEDSEDENVLRAPTNFTPVYGDFGPTSCSAPPTEEDFDAAFWVSAKQNAIRQTWSPRWTMFSRGNISEKARLLTLPSVVKVVEEGRLESGCAVVDLYCGVGYFSFSYVKAGITKVLGWDLNPWSIEGLRRGAIANKWGVTVFRDGETDLEDVVKNDEQLLVFNETNELAPERISKMRALLPPIRHINCGMLPSSRSALKLAAMIIDPRHDGWVHVHENFLISEIDQKAEETRKELQSLVSDQRGKDVRVELEYVSWLKSYAPGIEHCVLDILVAATDPA